MKLATSTGDFAWYLKSTAEMVREFKESNFKYLNLELPGSPEFFSDNDADCQRLASTLAEAADHAGVKYVVSHAPCLHKPIMNAINDPEDETYRANIRALRRSIEVCHILGIDRIVIHACADAPLTNEEFVTYNTMFYREFFDLMEKYNITVMTENWDNNATHFSTGRDMRDFIDQMDHPLLAACWDTAHGNIDRVARGIGQYENILTLGDKLKGMHVSDNFGDCHHHTWPFAGRISFDSVMQGLLDVNYDGFFTFEASYTLLHYNNPPYGRSAWTHNGEAVTKLRAPSLELKKKAVELLYDTGKYILETYDCFEE